MGTWSGVWAGGRTRKGSKGETVWVIERMRGGQRYAIAIDLQGEPRGTDAAGLLIPPREVEAELALFDRDPVAYLAATERGAVGSDAAEPSVLRPNAILEFLAFKGQGDSPVSKAHLGDLQRYLTSWMTALQGKDLRKVTLQEYRGHLRKLKPVRQHTVAIRSFTHWLRREGRLTSAQDATRDLEIPRAKVRRSERQVGYTMEHFEKLYAAIRARPVGQRGIAHHTPEEVQDAVRAQMEGAPVAVILDAFDISEFTFHVWKRKVLQPKERELSPAQEVRDVLALRALCGVHHSEVERIATGAWKVRRLKGYGEIAGTVTFWHKRGEPHPISLGAQALAAAERLQAIGRAPDKKTVHRVIDEAVEAAGLPPLRPGELRHSFVTWARSFGREVKPANAGVSREAVARVVGHTRVSTTGIYDGTEVPELIVLPLKLENPEDPT